MEIGNQEFGKAAGGAVDIFASGVQRMVDSLVEQRARQMYRATLREMVLEGLRSYEDNQCRVGGGELGVLLVIGVEEPRGRIDLVPVPTHRRFLGIGIAGYGYDPAQIRREYYQSSRLVAGPSNWTHLERKDYFVWLNQWQAATW